jgi:predicted nuclease of predicted toxin-antitoxin system
VTKRCWNAARESRILITFDKDLGTLAFHSGLPASSGVILFRIALSSPTHVAKVSTAAIESRGDWINQFSVVEEARIRMRPLPPTPSARSG